MYSATVTTTYDKVVSSIRADMVKIIRDNPKLDIQLTPDYIDVLVKSLNKYRDLQMRHPGTMAIALILLAPLRTDILRGSSLPTPISKVKNFEEFSNLRTLSASSDEREKATNKSIRILEHQSNIYTYMELIVKYWQT